VVEFEKKWEVSMKGATRGLAEFVVNLEIDEIPDGVLNVAKNAIIDTLGLGIVGAKEQSSKIVYEYVDQMGGSKESTIWAFGKKFPCANAALANGAIGHAHDFDDTHDKAVLHPGVEVIPAAMAVAERENASGRELLTAVVAGYEVHCRMGLASNVGPQSGWILTPTCGTFAAAAAAAKILNLDVNNTVNAFGIAHCMASGNTQTIEDGVWTKRLQVGHATGAGVQAGLLAQKGFTGAEHALEGVFGFYEVYFRDYELFRLQDGLGSRFETENVSFKPYPCCRFIHSAADAAFILIEKHEIRQSEVEKIVVGVTQQAFKIVCQPANIKMNPRAMVDAQFSIPYCVGCIVARRSLFLEEFIDEAIVDEEILSVSNKVECVVDPELEKRASREISPARMEIRMKNGETFRETVDIPKGHYKNPMSPEELQNKFSRCTFHVFSERRTRVILDFLNSLEEVKSVCSLLDQISLNA
jgi:2-methylcitrate dehydratase PrpD